MATRLDEIEKRLWSIADDLRANSGLKASEYSEPVLGLIFLRFANERFKAVTAEIQAAKPAGYEITNDDYLERNALMLPQYAQFDELLKLPEKSNMSKIINEAMTAIEELNVDLNGALPKSFSRLSTSNIFALLKALASISFDIEGDVFGKIYEYFLGEFAMAEGQRGGQFFTPTSIVQLIVEIIEPFQGRIFDPACGSGGMFVQSARFVRNHQRNPEDDVSIWGQEIMEETVRLCRMNLAVNGLSGTIKIGNSNYGELHDLWGQFDFVMANPPFNVSGVDKTKLVGDTKRYPFGTPRTDNANYLWIQMFYSALNSQGRAGFVMANSAGDARSSELDIRRELLQKKAVDVIVSISPNFFYTVTLPCTLWFFDKGKINTPRENTVLFIDARNIYHQIDRAHRDFLPTDIEFIANIVRLYRGEKVEINKGSTARIQETFPGEIYADIPGLCKAATLKEIDEQQGWSLNPGRYVGVAEQAIDNFIFREKLEELNEKLEMLNADAHVLERQIGVNISRILEESFNEK
jgi:type I restriction enzyme M protein